MGIRELRQEASSLGIKNYSKLNKADLQAAVDAAKAAAPTLSAALLEPDGYKVTMGNVPVPHTTVPVEVTHNSAETSASKALIHVAGRVIVVTATDTVESIGRMLGTFSKPDARKVRRQLEAAGLKAFAAAPRKGGSIPAEKAA